MYQGYFAKKNTEPKRTLKEFRVEKIFVAKELTKIYENIFYGKIDDAIKEFSNKKGEFVLIFYPEKSKYSNSLMEKYDKILSDGYRKGVKGKKLLQLIADLSGINKIGNYEGTIGWMESLGMPGIFLIPAIILEIGAPILIMIGYKVKISAALLSLFCIATAIIFHTDFSNQMQFVSFMKNIALAGGFLFLVINETKEFSLERKLAK